MILLARQQLIHRQAEKLLAKSASRSERHYEPDPSSPALLLMLPRLENIAVINASNSRKLKPQTRRNYTFLQIGRRQTFKWQIMGLTQRWPHYRRVHLKGEISKSRILFTCRGDFSNAGRAMEEHMTTRFMYLCIIWSHCFINFLNEQKE